MTDYVAFFDVEDSEQAVSPGHSTYNLQEAEMIEAIVIKLLAIGVPEKRILIIVGYGAHVDVLRGFAKNQGWGGAQTLESPDISTIDNSQGTESNVVIWGLTGTSGGDDEHIFITRGGHIPLADCTEPANTGSSRGRFFMASILDLCIGRLRLRAECKHLLNQGLHIVFMCAGGR